VARAKILHVIGIHTVRHGPKTARRAQLLKHAEKFRLAVVTTVRLVHDVQGILKFMRLDKLMPQVFLSHECFRLLPVEC
jgi:hypothetical protein